MASVISPPRGPQSTSSSPTRRPIFERPKFHPEFILPRAVEAAFRRPFKSFGVAAVSVFAILGLVETQPGDVVREKAGSVAVWAGHKIDDLVTWGVPQHGASQRASRDLPTAQDGLPNTQTPETGNQLAELYSRLPNGTRLVIESAVQGDGAWCLVHRENPELSTKSTIFRTAVQYEQLRPEVANGVSVDERIQVPRIATDAYQHVPASTQPCNQTTP